MLDEIRKLVGRSWKELPGAGKSRKSWQDEAGLPRKKINPNTEVCEEMCKG